MKISKFSPLALSARDVSQQVLAGTATSDAQHILRPPRTISRLRFEVGHFGTNWTLGEEMRKP